LLYFGSSAAQIEGGALRALAVASPKRAAAFPDVPTSGEAGVANFEVATWYAMWAPKGTPETIVARMTKELQAALASPAVMDAWKRNGSDIPNLYGAPFSTFVSAEVERWGKVVREAKVKID
jgi:tripartite-type tricarboxylate transporter receptor subunit TctC